MNKSWNRQFEDSYTLKKLQEASQGFSTTEKTVQVTVQDKTLQIFTRHASCSSPKGDVLFLHGMRFTSQNWEDINSLRLMAAMGYRGVAVDLPGYGQSKDFSVAAENVPEFMENLVSALGLTAPVIVSPSMSGGFSLPYLMKEPQTAKERCSGYVPVACVNTDKYTAEQYKKIQIPTVAINGSNDTTPMVGQCKTHFKHLPNSEIIEIPDAGHPAYLNKPDIFHTIMFHFLSDIFDKRS